MKMNDIIHAIRQLAQSPGMYGRLYRAIAELRDNDPDKYEDVKAELEAQNFSSPLDIILYFEC